MALMAVVSRDNLGHGVGSLCLHAKVFGFLTKIAGLCLTWLKGGSKSINNNKQMKKTDFFCQ